MDLSFLQEYFAPVIVGICLCIGFIIKKWPVLDKVSNSLIPSINGVLGIFLAVWMNQWEITPVIILTGCFSGLAATGLHQAFVQLIGGKRDE